MGLDSIYLCANYDSTLIPTNLSINLHNTCTPLGNNINCDSWVKDVNGDTVVHHTFNSNSINGNGPTFIYDSTRAPYTFELDRNCLNNHGIVLQNYSYPINILGYSSSHNAYDTIMLCPIIDSSYIPIDAKYWISSYCDNLPFFAENCDIWIIDNWGDTVSNQISFYNYSIRINHLYSPANAPYSIVFDQNCLNNNNLFLPAYSYTMNYQHNLFDNFMYGYESICAEVHNIPEDCDSVEAYLEVYDGYFQNTSNIFYYAIENNSLMGKEFQITIEVPNDVTLSPSTPNYHLFSQTGNIITRPNVYVQNMNFAYNFLIFNVPGHIEDSTLHEYILRVNVVDSNAICDEIIDPIVLVVGNSYDPNNKRVNKPMKIDPDVQDEFVYTVRFQNTGTAPAQDVYIDDTLSVNLDWSTFEFVSSSHSVVVQDLGNGVKRFMHQGIWLPDSTTDEAASQGYVTYKIKEKATNGEGSVIKNTAYIYFDHNPAIITNTTININTKDDLGLKKEYFNQVMIAPNPASSTLKVTSQATIEKIEIRDVNGKLCQEKNTNFSTDVVVPVNQLDAGIYFITVKSNNGDSVHRFIKR